MYLDELNTDMEFDLPEVAVSKERIIEFAKLYDPFPLHHDEEFARNTRFGQLVAPGVMSFMSVWAKFIDRGVLGDELIAGKSTKIEWFKPVFAGDTLNIDSDHPLVGEDDAVTDAAKSLNDVLTFHKHRTDVLGKILVIRGSEFQDFFVFKIDHTIASVSFD